jgi:hypothetical protein
MWIGVGVLMLCLPGASARADAVAADTAESN